MICVAFEYKQSSEAQSSEQSQGGSFNESIDERHNQSQDELLQKVFGNSQELPKKDPDGYTEMKFLYLLKMFEDFEYLGEVNKPFDGDVIVIA